MINNYLHQNASILTMAASRMRIAFSNVIFLSIKCIPGNILSTYGFIEALFNARNNIYKQILILMNHILEVISTTRNLKLTKDTLTFCNSTPFFAYKHTATYIFIWG